MLNDQKWKHCDGIVFVFVLIVSRRYLARWCIGTHYFGGIFIPCNYRTILDQMHSTGISRSILVWLEVSYAIPPALRHYWSDIFYGRKHLWAARSVSFRVTTKCRVDDQRCSWHTFDCAFPAPATIVQNLRIRYAAWRISRYRATYTDSDATFGSCREAGEASWPSATNVRTRTYQHDTECG